MKTIKYTDLLPKSQLILSGKELHAMADWSQVEVDDIVEIPNLFSYRVAFWDIIKHQGTMRAQELGARFQWRVPDATQVGWKLADIQVRLTIEAEVGNRAYEYPPHIPKPMPPAHHRGSYYGPEEGIIPLPGWNLVSLPSRYEQDELSNHRTADKFYDL